MMASSNASLTDSTDEIPPGLRALGVLLLLGALSFIAYAPAVRGGFVWDDDYYVFENPTLRNFAGLQTIWFDIFRDPRDYVLPQYYPLTHTSFWIEHRLWGMNPTGYHVTNVLLHLLSAMLVWLILRRLNVPGALLAAAVFAVHPVHVESVAWISERKNVLSLTLMLASLYTWLRFSGLVAGPDKPNALLSLPNDPKRLYTIGVVLFLLALFAKTTAAVLPACVLLLTWWKRGRLNWKQDVAPMLPLFVVGLAFARLTSWLEVHRVGASGPDWVYAQTPIGQFLAETLIAGRAIWFYVGKLVFPHPLIFNYPRFEPEVGNALQWLFPLAALAMLLALFVARNALGRGPLTAALWFVGVLLPALGFFTVLPHKYSFVADHFVYVASLGLITLFSAGVATLWHTRRWKPIFGMTLAGAMLFVLTGLSYRQARAYADEETLWRDTLAKNPASWIAANNLGVIHMERGELDRADELFARVLELKPDHVEVRLNIGLLNEMRGGKLADSVQWYMDAVRLEPRYAPAWHRLGLAYQRSAKQLRTQAAELVGWDRWFRAYRLRALSDRYFDAAMRSYTNALTGNPRYLPSLLQQTSLLMEYGRFGEAIPLLRRALVLDERNAQARANLFFALATVGEDREREEAVAIWNELTRDNPNDIRAFNLLGLSLARRGEWRAAAQFETAVRIDPRFVEGWYNLGLARYEAGDRDGALAALSRAIEIDPQYGPALRVLRRIHNPAANQPSTQPASQPATRPAS